MQRARRSDARAPKSGLLLLIPLLALPAAAADHGDGAGHLRFDVFQDLLEGSPYPAAAVELDVFRLPPDPILPLGRLLVTLVEAKDDATNDPVPLTGTAVSSGEPFGEPGDEVVLEVRFVPGAPPVDTVPLSFSSDVQVWAHPEPSSSPHLEFTSGEPLKLDVGLLFEEYDAKADVAFRDPTSGDVLGRGILRLHYAIQPGQGLRFASVLATPPDASNRFHLLYALERTGPVDSGEPLFTVTVTSEPVAIALLPAWGALAAAGALVALGVRQRLRHRR